MRTLLPVLLTLVAACGCDGDSDPPPTGVSFDIPSEGASILAPRVISVSGPGILSVTFLLDNVVQLVDGTAPFEWTLDPGLFAPGPHLLTVVADTDSGQQSVSRQLTFMLASDVFPLSIHASGRYLIQANGDPFLIHGDTPWSIEVQLTTAQVDTYLNDRESRGFNTILFEAMEAFFSSQTPPYQNANGDAPFGAMSPVDFTAPVASYWDHVDYIVNQAKARGIVCIVNPAYLGFAGGHEGWHAAVQNTSDSDLETYGEFLANRYTQGNVLWCMGGDYVPPDVTKQWKIVDGIRNVRTSDIITAHGARSDEEAYQDWSGQAGFNLNNIYTDGLEFDLAATAYARPGPIPFFLIEGFYENENGQTVAGLRRQAYASILSGACGHMFGNNPIWGFGEPNFNGGSGAANALATSLGSVGTQQMRHVRDLFEAHDWWKLIPMTGTQVVTSGLGSGSGRICPALAGDGSLAMIWNPNSGPVTVDMSALSPGSVRARFYDTSNGTYTTVNGSPFANSGTQTITWPGERVLILDAQ